MKKISFLLCLSFTAEAEQRLTMSKAVETLEYSVNNGAWQTLGTSTVTFGGANGNLRLRGKSSRGTAFAFGSSNVYPKIIFGNDTKVACTGDICTLVDYENYKAVNTSNARFCSLFRNCSCLTSAPSLPAETLASYCYESMFRDCSSLTSAPSLPAETLKGNCYDSMFYGCSSLTSAPTLPAEILESHCYDSMFYGCSKLNYIKMLATDISATNCLSTWTSGVSSTGTFVKSKKATWDVRGTSGIPTNWTVQTE